MIRDIVESICEQPESEGFTAEHLTTRSCNVPETVANSMRR